MLQDLVVYMLLRTCLDNAELYKKEECITILETLEDVGAVIYL